jgi:hypothetical protein
MWLCGATKRELSALRLRRAYANHNGSRTGDYAPRRSGHFLEEAPVNDRKAKRYVVRGDGKQPPRYFIGGGKITVEDIAWLYEKLTGKKCTPEKLRELEEAHAKRDKQEEE